MLVNYPFLKAILFFRSYYNDFLHHRDALFGKQSQPIDHEPTDFVHALLKTANFRQAAGKYQGSFQ